MPSAKAPKGGTSRKTTGSPEEGKATTKKKVEETREEPAGQAKAKKAPVFGVPGNADWRRGLPAAIESAFRRRTV
jgi:hypothetical protein